MAFPVSRTALKTLSAYVPGHSVEEIGAQYGAKEIIKLASNENPLGCPISLEALSEVWAKTHLYHNTSSHIPLAKALADCLGVTPDHLVLGNGSDEVLQLIALAYLDPGCQTLTSEHTFSQYQFVSHLMGSHCHQIPMKNFTYDLDLFFQAVTPQTKIIFIANPNNPTGTMVDHAQLTAFLEKLPSHILVVLDEAYCDYVEDKTYPNSLALLERFPNLIILRTFSKIYGLAALRIGYGIAHPDSADLLRKVRQPFCLNSISLKAAELALNCQNHYSNSLEMNRAGKIFLSEALTTRELSIIPTQANFLMIQLPFSAHDAFEGLAKRGLIVRSLASFGLSDAIRVTIGTPPQNQAFVQALISVLKER